MAIRTGFLSRAMVTLPGQGSSTERSPARPGSWFPVALDDGNFLVVQAMQLLEQEAFGLKREPLVVE